MLGYTRGGAQEAHGERSSKYSHAFLFVNNDDEEFNLAGGDSRRSESRFSHQSRRTVPVASTTDPADRRTRWPRILGHHPSPNKSCVAHAPFSRPSRTSLEQDIRFAGFSDLTQFTALLTRRAIAPVPQASSTSAAGPSRSGCAACDAYTYKWSRHLACAWSTIRLYESEALKSTPPVTTIRRRGPFIRNTARTRYHCHFKRRVPAAALTLPRRPRRKTESK